ncbi:histidinol-phosphate transaminase [Gardnerella greenwoodii]|uniref:histidinol-phosphate transaminase n=1 Tax=Gardnerella greenwoodii TaxID=2914925 RepID=UPI0039F13C2D
MTYKHRNIVDTIPSYKQGKPAPNLDGIRAYKISSNENPYEPLESVKEAISTRALNVINRYPNMRGTQVVEELAKRFGVTPDEVVLGCGSTEVITQLVDFVAGPGDEVVYPWRSFEAYPIIVTGAGAKSVQVPNRADGSNDVDGIINAINERTRLVILNNPNNPTSASLSETDARRVLNAVPSDVLVLIDEAYVQFNTAKGTADGMKLYREYPNVVVAQTFSKAYGLAGLRIGYGIAPAEVVEGMRKVAVPFGVSQIAQVAALASLEDLAVKEMNERVAALVSERERIILALRNQGWNIEDAYANFFWMPFGADTERVTERFVAVGLSVRAFAGEGIRISIGEREANDRVLTVCEDLKKDGFSLNN